MVYKPHFIMVWGNPSFAWFKELNPRRRVYVEIPKPLRVELKCSNFSDTREGFGIST
jgi:hypothetical protein